MCKQNVVAKWNKNLRLQKISDDSKVVAAERAQINNDKDNFFKNYFLNTLTNQSDKNFTN